MANTLHPGSDLYDVLQVSPDAEQEAISAAYKRLVFQHHPDRNSSPDATERTAEINRAYRILGNPAERAQYDRLWAKQVKPLPDISRVIVGASKLVLYEHLEPRPKHRQIRWQAGIWSDISPHFASCQRRNCLILLQIDPKNRHQLYQHGDPGPILEIDPKMGEFKLLKPWLEECHAREDSRRRG